MLSEGSGRVQFRLVRPATPGAPQEHEERSKMSEGLEARQAALFAKLNELGIKSDTKEHKQCFTVDDVERWETIQSYVLQSSLVRAVRPSLTSHRYDKCTRKA